MIVSRRRFIHSMLAATAMATGLARTRLETPEPVFEEVTGNTLLSPEIIAKEALDQFRAHRDFRVIYPDNDYVAWSKPCDPNSWSIERI